MSVKRILAKEIDTNQSYEVIGLDLAKDNVSFVGITTDGEVIRVDRVEYTTLIEKAGQMNRTVFGMEPCTEMNWLCNELKALGHECRVINGKAVQNQIDTYFSGQKNDLNDAEAIAYLARENRIQMIRPKSREEMILQTYTTERELMRKHANSTLVSLKGLAQAWGLKIAKYLASEIKLIEIVDQAPHIPEEIRESFKEMIKSCKTFERKANKLQKRIEAIVAKDKMCQKIMKVPAIGPLTAAQLRVTIGNIDRFDAPKKLPAYYGLVPKNLTTGHVEKMGHITKRGDKVVRSLVVQCASILAMLEKNDKLPQCPLTKWIKKKRKELGHCKLVVALAAKLLRIVWAILKYDKEFNLKRAGIARCNLPNETMGKLL